MINYKKVLAVAISACLVLGTACYAVGNIVSSWISSSDNRRAIKDYDEALLWLEKTELGSKMPKEFMNGYVFSQLDQVTTTAKDESENPIAEYESAMIGYTASEKSLISLNIEPVFNHETDSFASECRMIHDIEVTFRQYTYKMVPADYQLTPGDQADMLRDDFMLSYGSEEVCVQDLKMCSWDMNGIEYTFIGFDCDLQADDWFSMAAEVIEN